MSEHEIVKAEFEREYPAVEAARGRIEAGKYLNIFSAGWAARDRRPPVDSVGVECAVRDVVEAMDRIAGNLEQGLMPSIDFATIRAWEHILRAALTAPADGCEGCASEKTGVQCAGPSLDTCKRISTDRYTEGDT